jgi:preprotein translocase subunit SecA
MVTKAIERAQKQVEAQNFSMRKHLLEYDDVMNKQRENVYTLRRELLDGQVHINDDEVVDSRRYLMSLAEDLLEKEIETNCGQDVDPEDWDVETLKRSVGDLAGLTTETLDGLDLDDKSPDEMGDQLWAAVKSHYEEKEQTIETEILRRVERDVMLQIVDTQWKDHLYSLDHLKEGIGLRGYAQKDPLVEYKRESFELFQAMKERIDTEMVRYLWRLRPVLQGEDGASRPPARRRAPVTLNDPGAGAAAFGGAPAAGRRPQPARTGGDDAAVRTVRRDNPKVGRNDPCPCGSGKKYKKCHGA